MDNSHLDQKYFLDRKIYNCPFCKRGHVSYSNHGFTTFDWSLQKKCMIWRIKCDSCQKTSMHLTFDDIESKYGHSRNEFAAGVDLDKAFFYSVPTSFFVMDQRIPSVLRELITEAEQCIKMNLLTGASACTRKAIYEFLIIQKAVGDNYDERIKSLKERLPHIDATLFDVLGHIKDMTSEKVHEQSWDKWDRRHLTLFIETIKALLAEVYVIPDERKNRSASIQGLFQQVKSTKTKELVTSDGVNE